MAHDFALCQKSSHLRFVQHSEINCNIEDHFCHLWTIAQKLSIRFLIHCVIKILPSCISGILNNYESVIIMSFPLKQTTKDAMLKQAQSLRSICR